MHIFHKHKDVLFPVLLLLPIILLSYLRISGTSVGIYKLLFYGPDYKDPDLLFGDIRPIRWDEYAVATPWVLAQLKNNLEEQNTLYLAGQNLTISDAPTSSWAAIFEPQNWGFLFLPFEQAFAFRWWIKAFLLTTAAYILFMMMSNKDVIVSIMASLSLIFSPFIQWWYSTSAIEIAAYGLFTFIFYVKLIHSHKPAKRLMYSILVAFFAICFSLTIYPPFQIPFAVLLIFMGLGLFVKKFPTMSFMDIRNLALGLFVISLMIGAILAAYYLERKDSFNALAGTSYPGIRKSTGGDLNPFKALAGFYNIQLLDNGRTIPPELNHNQSEAASFFFFSYFLLPFLFYSIIEAKNRKHKIDIPLTLTLAVLCILILWGVTGLPDRIAKVIFLYYIDSYRMLFMLGLANHILIMYYLYRVNIEQTSYFKMITTLYALVITGLVFLIGKELQAIDSSYLSSNVDIALISITTGAMMLLLLFQRPLPFFSLFLAFSLASTFSVNPLYRGLASLTEGEFPSAIRQIQTQDPGANWVSYDSPILGNFLAANGVHVLSATHLYPNISFWRTFDPTNRYQAIYNRYAHVVVTPSVDQQITFELVTRDTIKLKISPCHSALRELEITYYVFTTPPADLSCLTLKKEIAYPHTPIYIYEYRLADQE